MDLPLQFQQVVKHVSELMGDKHQYAFRGTTSLVLQGYDMGLTDIDILADRGSADFLDRGLANFCLSPLKYSQTNIHKSFFGKYKIDLVPIEIMGEWQIKTEEGWSEIFDARASQVTQTIPNFLITKVPVTTAQTELRCYQLLGRWSTFHKLKGQIKDTSNKK